MNRSPRAETPDLVFAIELREERAGLSDVERLVLASRHVLGLGP